MVFDVLRPTPDESSTLRNSKTVHQMSGKERHRDHPANPKSSRWAAKTGRVKDWIRVPSKIQRGEPNGFLRSVNGEGGGGGGGGTTVCKPPSAEL